MVPLRPVSYTHLDVYKRQDLWHAFDRMEQVEQTAKIFALVHQLGGGVELSPEQVGAIRGLEGHYRTLSGSRTPHEEQGGGRT